jgi:hypothetical protein
VKERLALELVGTQRAVERMIAEASQCRLIDRIVVATIPELGNRTRRLVPEEIEVVELPDQYRDCPWEWANLPAGPVPEADVVAIIGTAAPFLKRGRIEGCLQVVLARRAHSARTVLQVKIHPNYPTNPDKANVIVDGVFAFRKARQRPAQTNSSGPLGECEMLKVGHIEALCLDDSDQVQIAQSLIMAGSV